MKLCKDCKHFVPDTVEWSSEAFQMRYARCALTAVVTAGDGKKCRSRRSPLALFSSCGRSGKQWEAK